LAATLTSTSTTSNPRDRPYGDRRDPDTARDARATREQDNDTSRSSTYLLPALLAVACVLATSVGCRSASQRSDRNDCQQARSTPCRLYSGQDYFAPIELIRGEPPLAFRQEHCGDGEGGYEYAIDFGETRFEPGTNSTVSVERNVVIVVTSDEGLVHTSQARIRINVDSERITEYQNEPRVRQLPAIELRVPCEN
jgi:hypothetical protein